MNLNLNKEKTLKTEDALAITLSLSLSVLTVTLLITGIILTELENSNSIYKSIERSLSLGSDFVGIVAVILGVVAYGQWRIQLRTARTIESLELAKIAIVKIKDVCINASVYIEHCNWLEKGRASFMIEKLSPDISTLENIYNSRELSHGKPLVDKEVRQQLMQINATAIYLKLRIESVVLALEDLDLQEDNVHKVSLKTAAALAKLEDFRKEWKQSYDKDMDRLSRIDSRLHDIGLSI